MPATGAVMRPVLFEIDSVVPMAGAQLPAVRSSLRPRIVVSSLLVVMCTSFLGAGLAARFQSPSLTLTLATFSGITVGAVFGLVLTAALSQSKPPASRTVLVP